MIVQSGVVQRRSFLGVGAVHIRAVFQEIASDQGMVKPGRVVQSLFTWLTFPDCLRIALHNALNGRQVPLFCGIEDTHQGTMRFCRLRSRDTAVTMVLGSK